MKVVDENFQRDSRYGTPLWPAVIQTPNWNGPNATTPRTVTVPADSPDDSPEEALVKRQWREAIALGLLADHPLSINPNAPE